MKLTANLLSAGCLALLLVAAGLAGSHHVPGLAAAGRHLLAARLRLLAAAQTRGVPLVHNARARVYISGIIIMDQLFRINGKGHNDNKIITVEHSSHCQRLPPSTHS